MKILVEAQKLVEELEQDELEGGDPSGPGAPTDLAVDVPPPSEPPVSDDALGADTEGNVALQLLADIRNLLAQLVGEEPGAEDLPPEGGPGDEEGAIDAIPEPPEDEEDEDEGAPGARMAPPA